MTASTYSNYQVTPTSTHSNGSQDLLDDYSIYSMTPFGGGSVFSPRDSMTPRDTTVQFDFPPELRAASSSESSVENNQMVPCYDPSPASATVVSQPSPRSTQPQRRMTPRSVCTSLTTSFKQSRVPRSSNPLGTDAVHPQKKVMKKQRKRRTAAGAVGGMVLGGLVLGPVGAAVGGAAGAIATNKIHKVRERRVQRKHEQDNFQQGANRSGVHKGAFA
jgi:hypothetical protein